MIWCEDDIELKAKHDVGRPVENPFLTEESEEDFARRGKRMLELYYKPSGPNSKKDFVFDQKHGMSKTLFWAITFLYLCDRKKMRNNLQGFLNAVLRHFGAEVACDRSCVCKKVNMLNDLHVTLTYAGELTGAAGRKQEEYRSKYKFVVSRWERENLKTQ